MSSTDSTDDSDAFADTLAQGADDGPLDASSAGQHDPEAVQNRPVTMERIKDLFGIEAPDTAQVEVAIPDRFCPEINPAYKFRKDLLRGVMFWHHGVGGPNIMLIGPSGTGKTSLIEQFAARVGRDVLTVQCHGRMEPAHFYGQVILADGGTGTVMQWADGPVVTAMRLGAIALLDEYDVLPPDTAAWLHRLRDERRVLIPETGELVVAEEGFRLAVTANTSGAGDDTGAYRGTRAQNVALLDGFTVLKVPYMDASDEEEVVMGSLGAEAVPEIREPVKRMIQVANSVRGQFEEGSIGIPITTRTLIRWAALTVGLMPLLGKDSILSGADLAFLNRADEEDRKAIQAIIASATTTT